MLKTSTHPDAQRFALASRAAEVEDKLPITEDDQNNLSSLVVGLIGSVIVAAVLLLVRVLVM